MPVQHYVTLKMLGKDIEPVKRLLLNIIASWYRKNKNIEEKSVEESMYLEDLFNVPKENIQKVNAIKDIKAYTQVTNNAYAFFYGTDKGVDIELLYLSENDLEAASIEQKLDFIIPELEERIQKSNMDTELIARGYNADEFTGILTLGEDQKIVFFDIPAYITASGRNFERIKKKEDEQPEDEIPELLKTKVVPKAEPTVPEKKVAKKKSIKKKRKI